MAEVQPEPWVRALITTTNNKNMGWKTEEF
jgi:hypothetical protein